MTAEPIPAPSTSHEPIVLQLSRRPAPYPPQRQQELRAQARTIIDRYPQSRSALLPLLHLVQSVDGYVTGTGIGFCAEQLGLTDAEVTAVATFYSMYRRTPTGDYHVGVCTNTLCAVMGGDEILAELARHLELAPGETTPDGAITLEHLECNAACDYAPVVMVNWEFFDNQTPDSARALADDLRSGREVTGTRSGAPVCTFRQTARVLAGFPDTRDGANAGEPGTPTLAGLRAARDTESRTTEEPRHDTGKGDRQ
ncbi:NADH-quinone oxidoreductase subunit NuoE [Nocardia vermiculata]|uniref:NADH-quinone oxidoreductase subunit NuoE n=1 Tax=Nocardia vermiculata TaxID=257274 RepID=A0A846Y073_9NOCA|nr:NADH-quinone oxidoreductase subunit NuoE [Nocardia vermiculata]NKY50688.1 NADH-quinone oxidoreductase subunit NuoE [Nocardia vermiculata]